MSAIAVHFKRIRALPTVRILMAVVSSRMLAPSFKIALISRPNSRDSTPLARWEYPHDSGFSWAETHLGPPRARWIRGADAKRDP